MKYSNIVISPYTPHFSICAFIWRTISFTSRVINSLSASLPTSTTNESRQSARLTFFRLRRFFTGTSSSLTEIVTTRNFSSFMVTLTLTDLPILEKCRDTIGVMNEDLNFSLISSVFPSNRTRRTRQYHNRLRLALTSSQRTQPSE